MPAQTPPVDDPYAPTLPAVHRGTIGGLRRQGHAPDSPQVVEARRALNEAKLERHIRQLVAAWPPLTAEQRTRLALLLRPDPADTAPGNAGNGAA